MDFTCALCGKKFARGDSLRGHMPRCMNQHGRTPAKKAATRKRPRASEEGIVVADPAPDPTVSTFVVDDDNNTNPRMAKSPRIEGRRAIYKAPPIASWNLIHLLEGHGLRQVLEAPLEVLGVTNVPALLYLGKEDMDAFPLTIIQRRQLNAMIDLVIENSE